MTRLKVVCGCKWKLHTDAVITPTELIRQANAHAEEFNHTVFISGSVERPRPKDWRKPIRRDYQRFKKPTVSAV